MRVLIAIVTAVTIALSLPAGAPAQTATKQDRTGPVTVAVTPVAGGDVLKVKVVLDTHSVGLDEVAFDKAVVVRTPGGSEVAARTVESVSGSGHHRSAVVVFPASAGAFQVVVRGVGGVAERVFGWDRPPAP